MSLPSQYQWLLKEPSPAILVEGLKLYGIKEYPGPTHNKEILKWADELGGWIGTWYDKDETAWCGLYVAICAHRAGFPFGQKALSALAWLEWGQEVKSAALGDILVFKRQGGGHVGIYVGEDAEAYHVLGGNQGNQVCISRIAKDRCVGIRRCKWRTAQPATVRPVRLSAEGTLSQNEA